MAAAVVWRVLLVHWNNCLIVVNGICVGVYAATTLLVFLHEFLDVLVIVIDGAADFGEFEGAF